GLGWSQLGRAGLRLGLLRRDGGHGLAFPLDGLELLCTRAARSCAAASASFTSFAPDEYFDASRSFRYDDSSLTSRCACAAADCWRASPSSDIAADCTHASEPRKRSAPSVRSRAKQRRSPIAPPCEAIDRA